MSEQETDEQMYLRLLRYEQETTRVLRARVDQLQAFVGLVGEAKDLLKGAADELELECGNNTTTDEIRAFLKKIGY